MNRAGLKEVNTTNRAACGEIVDYCMLTGVDVTHDCMHVTLL